MSKAGLSAAAELELARRLVRLQTRGHSDQAAELIADATRLRELAVEFDVLIDVPPPMLSAETMAALKDWIKVHPEYDPL